MRYDWVPAVLDRHDASLPERNFLEGSNGEEDMVVGRIAGIGGKP